MPATSIANLAATSIANLVVTIYRDVESAWFIGIAVLKSIRLFMAAVIDQLINASFFSVLLQAETGRK